MRVVAVIQARLGSSRLPGKVLEDFEGRPLIEWTLRAMAAIPGVHTVVVATTSEPLDDLLEEVVLGLGFPVHRGPVYDVLTRVWAAVEPFAPDLVLRQTADNPFADPWVAGAQRDRLVEDHGDYIGIAGWPVGIAAEVCRADALETAFRESTDPAEREHVMPFIYSRPDRYRVSTLARLPAGPPGSDRWRYTVDTDEDMELAHELAVLLGHGPPVRLGELETIMQREPRLATLNAAVVQRSWRVTELQAEADARTEAG